MYESSLGMHLSFLLGLEREATQNAYKNAYNACAIS